MRKFKKYKNTVGVIALSFALSACLNSEQVTNNGFVEDNNIAKAQSRTYAQSLQNYATAAQHAVSNSPDWLNGITETTAVLDLEAMGVFSGALSESMMSGYCIIDDANPREVRQITWFTKEDLSGNFLIGGVGNSSGQTVMRELINVVGGDSIGVYNNGAIKSPYSDIAVDVPMNCNFDIPQGSPVIYFDMEAPDQGSGDISYTDYKTVSCDIDEVGHKVMSLTAIQQANGLVRVGGTSYPQDTNLHSAMFDHLWVEHSNNCKRDIVVDVVDSSMQTRIGVDMSAMIDAGLGGSVTAAITRSLGTVECREAEQTENRGEDYVSGDYRDYLSEDEAKFSTCTDQEAPEAIGEIGDTHIELFGTEEAVQICGGSPETETIRFNGYSSTVNRSDWSGEVRYTRDVQRYALSDELTQIGEDEEDRLLRESWEGLSIECERENDLRIQCSTAQPDFAGMAGISVTDNRGYIYESNTTISGWANPEELEPNDEVQTAWQHVPGLSGCGWRQTRTDNLGCPPGEQGSRTETYRREFSDNLPATGSWSSWTLISSTDTCSPPPSSGSSGGGPSGGGPSGGGPSGGGPSGGGGGGTSCVLAGTRVLMADGSTKAIESIHVGEITAAGRVLQTYKRRYDNGTVHTSEGLFMNNGGLLEFDGIQATGRHPLYLNGKWVEMGDNKYASPITGTQDTIVYNLLTEDHVIPVIGKSGQLYAISDDLNNIHETAEKGRIKNLNLFAPSKKATA